MVVQILTRAEADEQLRQPESQPPPPPDAVRDSPKGKGKGKGKSGAADTEKEKKRKYMSQMKEKLDDAAAEDPRAAEDRERKVREEFERVKAQDRKMADQRMEKERGRSPQRASTSSRLRSPPRRQDYSPNRIHSPHRSQSLRHAHSPRRYSPKHTRSPHYSPKRTRSPHYSPKRTRSPYYSPRRHHSSRHSSRRSRSPRHSPRHDRSSHRQGSSRHAHHSRRDESPRRQSGMQQNLPIFFQKCLEKADDLKDVSADLFEYVGHSTAAFAVKKRLRGHLPVVPRGNQFHYDNRQRGRGGRGGRDGQRPAPAAPAPVIVVEGGMEWPRPLNPSEAEQFSGPWRNAEFTPSIASLTASQSYVAPEFELRPSVLIPVRVQSSPEVLDAVAAMEVHGERQPEAVRTEPPPPGSS